MEETIIIAVNTYMTSLILLYFFSLVVIPLSVWFFKTKRTSWGNFWNAWFMYAVILSLLTYFLVKSPHVVSSFFDFLKGGVN